MTRFIIGLGNPGSKYEHTRHNLGADIVRAWIGNDARWNMDEKLQAEVAEVNIQNSKVRIAALIPHTGMNLSGRAVAAYLTNKPLEMSELLIVHDDLELPLSEIQHVEGGSAKGHNGVRSVHEHLGTTDIPRLRLGVGRPPENVEVSDFVLSKFTPSEQPAVETMREAAVEALTRLLERE